MEYGHMTKDYCMLDDDELANACQVFVPSSNFSCDMRGTLPLDSMLNERIFGKDLNHYCINLQKFP